MLHSSSSIPDDRHFGEGFIGGRFPGVAGQDLLVINGSLPIGACPAPREKNTKGIGAKKVSHPRITKSCNRFRTNPTQLNHSAGPFALRHYNHSYYFSSYFFVTYDASGSGGSLERRSTEYGFKLIRGSASYNDLVQRSTLQVYGNWNSINCYR